MLVDTHCHIHSLDYPLERAEVLARAHQSGVDKIICVGTDVADSRLAASFAAEYDGVFASIGVHPHESQNSWQDIASILKNSQKLVAIGEIGLDYFYMNSQRQIQVEALEAQIQLALDYDKPIIFHVRQAFDDFWPIFDNFHGIRGVLHSFSDSMENASRALERGLYIGVNGISTFNKDAAKQAVYTDLPLDKMLLETDAPFLTPVPKRGKVNEPAFVRLVAENLAQVRQTNLENVADITTENARALFAL